LGEEKNRIEEQLFSRNRDLFTDLRLVFFDTTSLYVHGEGGELGARGHSRDHRPELNAVLSRPGRYRVVAENLQVKEVVVEGRRYIVCLNRDEEAKDARDRELILEALQYKRLLTGERFFREAKDLLETRPIFHEYQATIAGHIFVSFLALAVRHELGARLGKRGHEVEWADVVRDVTEVREVEVRHRGKDYILRPPLRGVSGKVFQAAGVAIPPPVREALPPGAKA
ncbi:MAG: hypothetical protein NUV94_07555, partial [Candidatus Acetothermia bacterium]|nr:hypothetical protein [Candidatus Acetothermia bacterium]